MQRLVVQRRKQLLRGSLEMSALMGSIFPCRAIALTTIAGGGVLALT